MAYDIFISYSTTDQKIVEGLSAYLEQNGIRCFVAYRDIPKGVVWAKAITEALEKSKLMVVVFSEHFNRSEQVDREIEMCIEERKPILTFRIEDTAFSGAKKYYLKNINWIDAFPNPKEYFGKLLTSIKNLFPELETEINKREKGQQKLEQERLDREKTEKERLGSNKEIVNPKRHPIISIWLFLLFFVALPSTVFAWFNILQDPYFYILYIFITISLTIATSSVFLLLRKSRIGFWGLLSCFSLISVALALSNFYGYYYPFVFCMFPAVLGIITFGILQKGRYWKMIDNKLNWKKNRWVIIVTLAIILILMAILVQKPIKIYELNGI